MLCWMMWLACWMGPDRDQRERVGQMQDHQADWMAARDALARNDLEGAQDAARRLAMDRSVPGIPEAWRPSLAAVRTAAGRLAVTPEVESAADVLVAMTASCADCHTLGAVPVPPVADSPEAVWAALSWENESAWEAARVRDPDGLAGNTWPARRASAARRLASAAREAAP